MNKRSIFNLVYTIMMFIAIAIGINAVSDLKAAGLWFLVLSMIATVFKWVYDRGR